MDSEVVLRHGTEWERESGRVLLLLGGGVGLAGGGIFRNAEGYARAMDVKAPSASLCAVLFEGDTERVLSED